MKKNKGITLIALVVTIIILIILAGVSIKIALNDNGIVLRTEQATQEYKNEQVKEQEELYNMYSQLLVATNGTITVNTQELKEIVLEMVYPIGSIYMSTSNVSPATFLGGEWEKYSEGRTIIGDGENGGYTFTAGSTGTEVNATTNPLGEYKHTLTINEMPSHNHNYYNQDSNAPAGTGLRGALLTNGGKGSYNNLITYAGGSQSHNNIQPYIVTYIWKRTK